MRRLDMSKITNDLYVGRTPYGSEYKKLKDLGVDLVINMRAEWPTPLIARQKLIQDVWVPSLDLPIGFVDQSRLKANAKRAKDVIDNGGKVYVFCRKGRHRSVAMASAILLSQGYTLDQIKKLFAKQRPVADLKRYQVNKAVSQFAKTHSKKK